MQSPFEQFELSHCYLSACPELAQVELPFPPAALPQQLARRDLDCEFELLRAVTETKRHRLKLRVNSILENKKNRYPEQSIYEHSRVKLEGGEGEDYVNANYVPGGDREIIITQGPLEHTQDSFEAMLKERGVECVVMLCNILENGKVRCFDYLANRNKHALLSLPYLEVNAVQLPNHHAYTHVHYSEWPDRTVPADKTHIQALLAQIGHFRRIVIHCSAGLGRSGVVAALLTLQNSEEISIFGTVRRMREHRFGAVQNSEQYGYIYSYLEWQLSQ